MNLENAVREQEEVEEVEVRGNAVSLAAKRMTSGLKSALRRSTIIWSADFSPLLKGTALTHVPK